MTQSAARTISNFFGRAPGVPPTERLLREDPRERELVEHPEDHARGDVARDRRRRARRVVLRRRDDAAEHAQEVRELRVLVLLHELAALAQLDREHLGGGGLVVHELQVRLDERAQLLARRLDFAIAARSASLTCCMRRSNSEISRSSLLLK